MKQLIWITFFALLACVPSYSQVGGEPPQDSSLHYVVDSTYAQSPVPIAIEAQTAVRFANSADVYLKWAPVAGAYYYTVMYSLGNGGTSTVWNMAQSATNQIVLPNIPLNVDISWSVLVGNVSAPTNQSYTGSVSTKPQTEPIKVSGKFYNQLESWFAKENNPITFCQFLAASDVNQYEKLSFMQVYYFNNASFVKPSAQAATVMTNWYPPGSVTGAGSTNPCIPTAVVGCNCKIITMGSNIATPNGKMENFKIHPRFLRMIVALSPDGDIAMSDRFEAGAAKYISLKQNIGGWPHQMTRSNLAGTDDPGAVTTEASSIAFFLACLINGDTTTNIPANCACEKPLHIYYEYEHRLHVRAEKKICPWSKGAEATAEDMAFVAYLDGKTGDLTPLKAGQNMLSASCSSNWNPQFWINVVNLLTPVGQFYLSTLGNNGQNQVPTTAQLDAFIASLKTLITTSFSNNNGACDDRQSENTLLSGNHTFLLKPNSPIRVSMFSAYYLRTRGYGCWRAEAGVASDYYLMGVVESELTDGPCCSDKFANYIVGSLSSPSSHPQYPLTAVNSIQNRLQDVGSNLATFGPWDGLSQQPGSGIVILQREFDNSLVGRSCIEGLNDRAEEPSLQPIGSFSADGVKIYPTATNDFLNVEINAGTNDQEVEITLFNLQGAVSKALYKGQLVKGDHLLELPVNEMPQGNYILRCKVGDRIHSFKVLIL